jgi:hypothetical protein
MVQFFGNLSDTTAIVWQPASETRGTFSILSSCAITLILCAWTAVHLNIPEQPNSKERPYLRKAKWLSKFLPKPHILVPVLRKAGWLVLGLLAPELVAFTAWYQYVEAKRTARLVSRAWGYSGDVKPPRKWLSFMRDVKPSDVEICNKSETSSTSKMEDSDTFQKSIGPAENVTQNYKASEPVSLFLTPFHLSCAH